MLNKSQIEVIKILEHQSVKPIDDYHHAMMAVINDCRIAEYFYRHSPHYADRSNFQVFCWELVLLGRIQGIQDERERRKGL